MREHKQVFAVLRWDKDIRTPTNAITVKEVLPTEEEAAGKVERLNRLNADKGALYFWQTTRLLGEPSGDHRISMLLSAQRALLGEITACIRAVSIDITDVEIVLWVYTDGDATQQLREDFDAVVITQMIADLPGEPNDPQIRVAFERCDVPAQISIRGTPVFLRAEPQRD